MPPRPTLADVAKTAGVGIATVDRVLNGRLPVREETAARVYEAAKALGYHAAEVMRRRAAESLPLYSLAFILQRPQQAFYQAFHREIEAACTSCRQARIVPDIHFVAAQTPSAMADLMKAAGAKNMAVAAVSPDYPALSGIVHDLRDRGVPVMSVLSDMAQGVRDTYIGVDNYKAGRTAAWIISHGAKRPGKVAVLIGSHRFHGHELREVGFRSFFREKTGSFEVLDTFVNMETTEITYEMTSDLLAKHPDLAGLYVAGGGMEGAIAAVRDEGFTGKVQLVVNELTPETRSGLADEVVTAVVNTPLEKLARQLVDLMARAIERGPSTGLGQIFLPFELYTPENI